MEVVKDFEFKERGARGKYQDLYKEFLALPAGTAVKFTKGPDFAVEANKFAISLRTGLWNKGYKAKVAVRGDDVFAQVVGPREKTKKKVASVEEATGEAVPDGRAD